MAGRAAVDFDEYVAASALRSVCRASLDEVRLLDALSKRLADDATRSGGPASLVSVAGWYDALQPYFAMAMCTRPSSPPPRN